MRSTDSRTSCHLARHVPGLFLAAALLGPSALPSGSALPQSPRPGETWPEAQALSTVQGEQLLPDAIGPTIVEGWEEVLAREVREPATVYDRHRRSGAQGSWVVASRRRHGEAHSGEHYAVNKWGDPRMGIGFRRTLDVQGAWFIGQNDRSFWPATIVVVGYRAGVEVARTDAFSGFSDQATWFTMNLASVDRIEIHVDPRGGSTGLYGMDDLTLTVDGASLVVDFETLRYQDSLTGSGYAGFDWEVGTGDFPTEVIHAPLSQESDQRTPGNDLKTYGGSGTAPTLVSSFTGPRINDAGGGWIPPDTCGAVGPTHFVTVVNSNISVWSKATGARLMNTSLNTFLNGDSFGDPRVTYDFTSGRFIVNATDFDNEISFAISNSSDAMGAWTKATFNPAQGSDAGKWPDYQTLGCNKDFIATCAYMVGGSNQMTCFAIDKQNFINTGTLTVTAFRGLPWEGAIHPATTWDATASQYLVSRATGGLRIRRLNLPASAPTLSELGTASVSVGSSPPNAPQLGGPSLDTLDGRPMNSVWINGSIWTTNCISSGGRAGCRWYQVSTSSITVTQTGTVDDPSLHFFAPSIAVNTNNDVAMGFSGSNASQFAGVYFTGRLSSDPAGQMGVPVLYKAGEGSYDDGSGPRWGDYSLTSIDPTDNRTFWTIQEYAGPTGSNWRTYIAQLAYPGFTDCNGNGIDDAIDISSGTSQDCDGNGVPDECQADCDSDGTPDTCEVDCNANGIPDDCETFTDCNGNGIPDDCEPDCDTDGVPDDCEADCDGSGIPDDCESFTDCNDNGIPDICESLDDCDGDGIADICEPDCDTDGLPDDCESDCDENGIPDDCEVIFTDCDGDGVYDACEADCDDDGRPDDCEVDCNGNGTPDDCESFPDCNGNGIPDECDISSGTSIDADGDGVPDECEVVETPYCFCTVGVCANPDAGAGCRNSTGAGALFATTGTSSVTADDLLLTMSPLAPNQFGLFYMGTTTPSIPFGDGFRCVGGSIFRYPVQNSGAGGSITFGPIVGWANTHFAAIGHISSGDTWNFQGWYRDPAGPCGGAFNLSNASAVTFTP